MGTLRRNSATSIISSEVEKDLFTFGVGWSFFVPPEFVPSPEEVTVFPAAWASVVGSWMHWLDSICTMKACLRRACRTLAVYQLCLSGLNRMGPFVREGGLT